MTNEIVKVNPVVVDEIEFYVSSDGHYTGMSQSGLARLCGVEESTIRRLIAKLGSAQVNTKTLESLTGKESWTRTSSPNQAEVIPSKVCSGIIAYYAFESKAKNDIAKYSLAKFSTIGIDKWIKEITGYAEKSEELLLLDSIKEVLKEVKELKQTTVKYENIRGKTTVVFPNLDTMLDELALEENLILENNNEEMTATEWLSTKGITLDRSKRHKFAGMLAETYKSMTKKEPKKVVRTSRDGKKNNGVSVYRFDELPILQLCLNKLLV